GMCAVLDPIGWLAFSGPEHQPSSVDGPSTGRRLRPSRSSSGSDRALLHLTALAFGQASPDPEAFVVLQGILQALHPNLTAQAHLLRLAGRTALLREERLGVGLRAQGTLLPPELLGVSFEQVDIPFIHGPAPFDPNEGTSWADSPLPRTTQLKLHGWN